MPSQIYIFLCTDRRHANETEYVNESMSVKLFWRHRFHSKPRLVNISKADRMDSCAGKLHQTLKNDAAFWDSINICSEVDQNRT